MNRISCWALLLPFAAGILLAQSGSVTLDFEGFADGTILTNQYSRVTFQNTIIQTAGKSIQQDEFPPHSGVNVAGDNGGPVTATFTSPVQTFKAFFTYRTQLTLKAFDNSNNQVAVAVSRFATNDGLTGNFLSSPNELMQVSFNGGISKVTITGNPAGGSFVFDDATFQSGTPTPNPVSVTAAYGSAMSQTFALTFSDPRGFQDLGTVNTLINNNLDGRHACYLAYSQPLDLLYLVGDDGGTLSPGANLSVSGTTANSQCTINWGDGAAARNGNQLTLMLTIGFNTSFAGNKVVYLAARDVAENNSGWQPLGVWQVPAGSSTSPVAVGGMSPAQGSGHSPTAFTFTFSDTNGFADLGVENILINSALDGRHACYLAYARSLNVLYLVNDTGDALLPGQALNASGSINNSQCTVSWGAAPVNASGNGLALTLNIAFSLTFGGNRVFYLAARDIHEGNNTDWQPMGTWTVQ